MINPTTVNRQALDKTIASAVYSYCWAPVMLPYILVYRESYKTFLLRGSTVPNPRIWNLEISDYFALSSILGLVK